MIDIPALTAALDALSVIPALNAGGCALVASQLASKIPGAKVYPVGAFDTDKIRAHVGDPFEIQEILSVADEFRTHRGDWRTFTNHFVIRLPDGREVDSNGIVSNGTKSSATGEGFSAEEAGAWFWNHPDDGTWNTWFNRDKYADKVVEIVNDHLA